MKITKKMIKQARLNNAYDRLYGEVVEFYISEKYTNGQEKAISRQRINKPDEFEEYFRFCEECKERAKIYLESIENS